MTEGCFSENSSSTYRRQYQHTTGPLPADHLLDNALKYTPEGGTIQIHVGPEDGAVVVRVSDSGMGFDPEQSERLFDRFYRSNDAERSADGGGLGLSIVKAVAE